MRKNVISQFHPEYHIRPLIFNVICRFRILGSLSFLKNVVWYSHWGRAGVAYLPVWVWYSYFHFHKTVLYLIWRKHAFYLKRGVLLALKISDFGWKRGVFVKNPRTGGVFQIWVRAWYTLWSGDGGRGPHWLNIRHPWAHTPQSLATNSPAPGPRPLICGVSSECLGTRSYETTSRDQRGKIKMIFSSSGACTATKSPIANHRSLIVAQLYFASVTQMFRMPLFVKVESGSSKLLRTVSKSGSNGCKERSRPQKMLMRIKIESFLGRQNLVLTVTHCHKQPREERKMIVTWTALIIITKKNLNPPTWL